MHAGSVMHNITGHSRLIFLLPNMLGVSSIVHYVQKHVARWAGAAGCGRHIQGGGCRAAGGLGAARRRAAGGSFLR